MPEQRMSIKDYIALMRETDQPMAFTNIAGQAGQFAEGRAHVTPEYQIAGPGGAPTPQTAQVADPMGGRTLEPGPAMPARPAPVDQQEIDQNDPWAMATAKLEPMLEEIKGNMFPTKAPGDKLSPDEWKRFSDASRSVRNAMVDRYKWQIDRRDKKDEEDRKVREKAGVSHKQVIDMQTSLLKSYDPMNPEQESQEQ